MTQPFQLLVNCVARCFPGALFYRGTTEKLIALTIDDVPVPVAKGEDNTIAILEAIAQHNQRRDRTIADPVRATFFVTASHLRNGSTLVQRIRQEGHEIGNHGYVDDYVVFEHRDLFRLQFEMTHQTLLRHGASAIRWYRPARALYKRQMIETVKNNGYEKSMALASMIPLDASDGVMGSPWLTQCNIALSTFPGAILLLHGGTKQRSLNTVKVLEKLLPKLDKQGYRVVTLSQLYDTTAPYQ
jgi:peptidoglycan-N-acetylglucosamine deacetylase